MEEIVSMVSKPESDSVFSTRCHPLNQNACDFLIKHIPSLINTSHTGETVLSHGHRAESRQRGKAEEASAQLWGHVCYCSKMPGSSTSSGQKNGKNLVIW